MQILIKREDSVWIAIGYPDFFAVVGSSVADVLNFTFFAIELGAKVDWYTNQNMNIVITVPDEED